MSGQTKQDGDASQMATMVPGGDDSQAATMVPDAACAGGDSMAETAAGNLSGNADETAVPAAANSMTATAAPGAVPASTAGPDVPPALHDLPGFDVKRLLGKGGMGSVYLAQHRGLKADRAIKVMAPELADKPGFVERFNREAQSMARIDHPNVVRCFDVGQHNGLNYMVLELIEGQSMQDWLDQVTQLSVGDAVLLTLVAAEALGHAHKLKMIHRDIKPDNLLVTKDGQIKVADLGLAKALDEDMSMTQSGHGLGTPHYMPPEQARNAKHVDHRSDIYALGATLYHFLSGTQPFAGESVVELITNKEKGTYKELRLVNREVPERLSLICDKMMAKDKEHRYQSMEAVVKDLDGLGLASDALSFIDSPEKVAPRRGGAATVVGGATIAAAGAAAAGVAAKRKKPAAGPKVANKGMADSWFVRIPSGDGKRKLVKATTAQLVARIKAGNLPVDKVTVGTTKEGPYLKLAEVPAFSRHLESRARVEHAKKTGRADQAERMRKLAKQHDRRKIWQKITSLFKGVTGFAGLLIWLAVVAAVGYGLYVGGSWAWQTYGGQLNGVVGGQATEAAAPAE